MRISQRLVQAFMAIILSANLLFAGGEAFCADSHHSECETAVCTNVCPCAEVCLTRAAAEVDQPKAPAVPSPFNELDPIASLYIRGIDHPPRD